MNQLKLAGLASLALAIGAHAALLTDANDARNWQGATVGTFAQLYLGSNTLANRQTLIDNGMLDDGIFDPTGYATASLVHNAWSDAPGAGGCVGVSTDLTGAGGYSYGCGAGSLFSNADAIDNYWFQTGHQIGETVYDLGFQATRAAVFNVIDHGPIPNESIETSVYLSNDQIHWTAAQVQRVYLEGFEPNTGIQWDGFTYVVGTGTSDTFRYASMIHGGPAALQDDGDNEINGMMGLDDGFHGTPDTPEPGTLALMGLGLGLLSMLGLRRKRA